MFGYLIILLMLVLERMGWMFGCEEVGGNVEYIEEYMVHIERNN